MKSIIAAGLLKEDIDRAYGHYAKNGLCLAFNKAGKYKGWWLTGALNTGVGSCVWGAMPVSIEDAVDKPYSTKKEFISRLERSK